MNELMSRHIADRHITSTHWPSLSHHDIRVATTLNRFTNTENQSTVPLLTSEMQVPSGTNQVNNKHYNNNDNINNNNNNRNNNNKDIKRLNLGQNSLGNLEWYGIIIILERPLAHGLLLRLPVVILDRGAWDG